MKIAFDYGEELILSDSKTNQHTLNMIALFAGFGADDLIELVEKNAEITETDKKRILWHVSKLLLISDTIYNALEREGLYA